MRLPLFQNQQTKARIYFALLVFINISVLSVIITGILYGINRYVTDTQFTYRAVTCCGGICLTCFFSLHTLYTLFPWFCMVLFSFGIAMAIRKTSSILFLHYRLTHSIPPLPIKNHIKLKKALSGICANGQTVLIDASQAICAFTSGIWKPRIYLSTGICSYLTSGELLAVILHETHHKKSWDPLKLFILQLFKTIHFFLPVNNHLINLYVSASEKAADDAAINISGEPLELASALVKLSQCNTRDAQYFSVAFSKKSDITEDRLRRLLESETVFPSWRNSHLYLSSLFSLFITITICISLFYRPFPYTDTTECVTRACTMTTCELP